eukprot:jgi/Chrzof1/9175/Cz03g38220.t1
MSGHGQASLPSQVVSTSFPALLLVMLLATAGTTSAQSSCPVTYSKPPGSRPLLYGGIYDDGVCKSGCKSRTDFWGKACAFNPATSGWGTCSALQQRKTLSYATQLGTAASLQLSPCDLWPYLKGRTLWLIGDSHFKVLYKAFKCFLIDFWDHTMCQASTDPTLVSQLNNLPQRPGESQCIHMPGGTRICLVHNVLGTSLLNNQNVAYGGLLPMLRQKFASRNDIFIVNFGVWHGKGLPNEGRPAFQKALTELGQTYQVSRNNKSPKGLREVSGL